MTTWPASLPQFVNVDSYQESFVDNVIRSQMSIGSKTRLRDTKEIRQFKISITCDGDQRDAFRTFYRDTLAHGSLPFDWVEFADQTTVIEYIFTGSPDIKAVGPDIFVINMGLATT